MFIFEIKEKNLDVGNFLRVSSVDRSKQTATAYKIQDTGELYSLVINFDEKSYRFWDILDFVKKNNLLHQIKEYSI